MPVLQGPFVPWHPSTFKGTLTRTLALRGSGLGLSVTPDGRQLLASYLDANLVCVRLVVAGSLWCRGEALCLGLGGWVAVGVMWVWVCKCLYWVYWVYWVCLPPSSARPGEGGGGRCREPLKRRNHLAPSAAVSGHFVQHRGWE
jgi:hypothetical protein